MVPKREVHGGSGSPICMIPIRILGFGDGGTVEDPFGFSILYTGIRYGPTGFKKKKKNQKKELKSLHQTVKKKNKARNKKKKKPQLCEEIDQKNI